MTDQYVLFLIDYITTRARMAANGDAQVEKNIVADVVKTLKPGGYKSDNDVVKDAKATVDAYLFSDMTAREQLDDYLTEIYGLLPD